MVDLIFIDVDGTLVGSSGQVRPAVWAAAARARARGVRLAICSGRPAFGKARGYAEQLDPDGWHVFQNGASVVHLPTGESHSRPLPAGALAGLLDRAEGDPPRVLELYADTRYAASRDTDRARRHADLLGLPFAHGDPRAFPDPVVRAQWLVAHAEVDGVVAEPHEGLTLSPSVSPAMPDTAFVNITPAGVDKASAVRAVAAQYGVPLARVMMVGDGDNDVAALLAVGVPVAMGNAEPRARAAARHEVAHVDQDGLVEALELALRARVA